MNECSAEKQLMDGKAHCVPRLQDEESQGGKLLVILDLDS
jgi:hypothetical protein